MRNFIPSVQYGHNAFFKAFSGWNIIVSKNRGKILASLANRAANEHELYLEILTSPNDSELSELANKITWSANFEKMEAILLNHHFKGIVNNIGEQINNAVKVMQSKLKCNTKYPQAGCQVTVKFQYEAERDQEPASVFAQLLAGFEVVKKP